MNFKYSLDPETFADQIARLKVAAQRLAKERNDTRFSAEEWYLLKLTNEHFIESETSDWAEIVSDRLLRELSATEESYAVYFAAMATDTSLNLFNPDFIDADSKEKVGIWIDELRSGNYTQGCGLLREEFDGNKVRYCCLGVADTCLRLQAVNAYTLSEVHQKIALRDQQGYFDCPPEIDIDKLQHMFPSVVNFRELSLVKCNDNWGWTFEMIANFIERQFNIAANPRPVPELSPQEKADHNPVWWWTSVRHLSNEK